MLFCVLGSILCGGVYACCVVESMLVVWLSRCLLCGGVDACCVV